MLCVSDGDVGAQGGEAGSVRLHAHQLTALSPAAPRTCSSSRPDTETLLSEPLLVYSGCRLIYTIGTLFSFVSYMLSEALSSGLPFRLIRDDFYTHM